MAERKEYRVFRLCGIPGDTVEIKNGDLFVNNRNTAGMFDCCFPYQVDAVELLTLNQLLKLPEEDIGMQPDKGKAELILNKTQLDQVKKLKIPVERKITPKFEKDEMISRIFGQPWNIDHFGPLVIPADRYFVLGDNRHRAQDSRYIGLIPTSDLYGTVISK
jgi:signal peptidase I